MEALGSLVRAIEMRIERQRKILAQSEKELAALVAIDAAQRKLPLVEPKAR